MSTVAKTYSPLILQPTLKQRIPGVRVFLIQSQSDPNQFHFMGIYPDGYIRCQCEAGRHNRQCKHKLALIEHIEAAQRVEPMLADMTPKELVEAFNRRRMRNNLPLLLIPRRCPHYELASEERFCPICHPQTTTATYVGPYEYTKQEQQRQVEKLRRETAPLADNNYAGSIFR